MLKNIAGRKIKLDACQEKLVIAEKGLKRDIDELYLKKKIEVIFSKNDSGL